METLILPSQAFLISWRETSQCRWMSGDLHTIFKVQPLKHYINTIFPSFFAERIINLKNKNAFYISSFHYLMIINFFLVICWSECFSFCYRHTWERPQTTMSKTQKSKSRSRSRSASRSRSHSYSRSRSRSSSRSRSRKRRYK